MINYENDLREIALNLLDSAGVYYKSKDDTNRLVIRYYTFCENTILFAKSMFFPQGERYMCPKSCNLK